MHYFTDTTEERTTILEAVCVFTTVADVFGKWCTSKSARLISSVSQKGLHILHLNKSTFSFCEKTCMLAKTKEWTQKRAETHDLHKCTLTSCNEMSSLISRLHVWCVNIFNRDLIIISPLIIIEKTKDFCKGVGFFFNSCISCPHCTSCNKKTLFTGVCS